MVFSSVVFLFYFLPISLGLYYVAPAKAKNAVLLAASLFFYAWGEPVYVLLMIFSIAANYTAGLLMNRAKVKSGCTDIGLYDTNCSCVAENNAEEICCKTGERSRQGKAEKRVLAGIIIIDILLIGVFKYADFIIESIGGVFGIALEPLNLPLPIGISFYTFQAMSYVIDLYRGDVRLQRNIVNFAAYISMFPQLIAGPIVRLKDIEQSLDIRDRKHGADDFAYGVKRFTVGIGKKVLLANNAGLIWDAVRALPEGEVSVLTAWIGIIGFTFQIYFDFSGYSDMAIGLGKMLGFHFPENFNYPYMSKSITEFWRRWHISLGTWFREYVYIPLGGNRKGSGRQVLNIFIVWFLTGLWHGASWNFVLWGLYFAVLLSAEKAVMGVLERVPAGLRHLGTMFLVVISWVIFAIESPAEIVQYVGTMFGVGAAAGAGPAFADSTALYMLRSNLVFLIVFVAGCTDLPKRGYNALTGGFGADAEADEQHDVNVQDKGLKSALESGKAKISARKIGGERSIIAGAILDNIGVAAVLILSIAYVAASTYNPFLYFRF